MNLGRIPLLTKGPFALFYGGHPIIPQLSSEEKGFPTAWMLTLSVLFHIFMIFFRKNKARKLDSHQLLKESVISNFLNIFSSIFILLVCVFLTCVAFVHYNTIRKNSGNPEAILLKDPDDYWIDLAFLACAESGCQFATFFTNPAFRFFISKL